MLESVEPLPRQCRLNSFDWVVILEIFWSQCMDMVTQNVRSAPYFMSRNDKRGAQPKKDGIQSCVRKQREVGHRMTGGDGGVTFDKTVNQSGDDTPHDKCRIHQCDDDRNWNASQNLPKQGGFWSLIRVSEILLCSSSYCLKERWADEGIWLVTM